MTKVQVNNARVKTGVRQFVVRLKVTLAPKMHKRLTIFYFIFLMDSNLIHSNNQTLNLLHIKPYSKAL